MNLARTPTELRRLARQRLADQPGGYRFRLAYRPPYDWDTMLAFLSARATPGVESVEEGRYRRTISIAAKTGVLEVSHLASRSALSVEVRFPDPQALLVILERVRRMFDLGADPAVIGEHLRMDPLLGTPLAEHPGIRTPGAWNGFELAVRAILGQQISVRAATTLAGRIAVMFGSPLDDGKLGSRVSGIADERELARLFPTPTQLANAALERAGVMPARAATIRSLARHVVDGSIAFGTCSDDGNTIAALRALPGIGDWTAAYIAMRAFGDPNAFPSGDLILRRAAGNCSARELERRSAAWRPWRAYAVMLLWQDQGAGSRPQGSGPRPQHKVTTKGMRRPIRPQEKAEGIRAQAHRSGPRRGDQAAAPEHYGEEHDQSNDGGVMRGFPGLQERQTSEDAFYGSEEWKQGPREAVLADIVNDTTVVIRVDDATRRGLRMPNTTAAASSDLATLLDLNRDYIQSVQTSNVQRFREILADDFLCSNPDGSLIDRERFLAQTAKPVTISDLQAHDVNVRVIGDLAIVHARTTFTGPDGRAASGRYTDVWAKRQGKWLAISAHVTRLP